MTPRLRLGPGLERGLLTNSGLYRVQCRNFSISRPRRSDLPKVPLWINGEAVSTSSAGTARTRHSKTREESCQVVLAGEQETEQAIKYSMKAFKEWRETIGWKRREILGNVVNLLKERLPALAEALQADVAISPTVIGADQKSVLNITDGAAATAISIDGWIPSSIDDITSLVLREPHGPVLSIPAFNFPLTLTMRSIVYPIACGNTVILKSPALLPQLHHLLGSLFRDAGLPAGVFQILNFSDKDVGKRVEQMIAHEDIRMVNFTGSTGLGRKLASLCAQHLKPSVMELGGKCPAIVLPGADLKLAANNIIFGAFLNSGQICMSTERTIVHSSLAEDFESALREAISTVQDRQFDLMRPGAVTELKGLLDDATSQGARIITSKPVFGETSSSPIILADVPSSSTAYTDESFAPLLSLITATDTAQAIEIANSHPAGLSSAVFTSDIGLALSVAKKLEVGAVHINGMTVHDQHSLPFGGVRDSGWGKFNGRAAIEAFTRTKVVRLGVEGHMLPLEAL